MESRAQLLEVLTRAQSYGLLGPGDPATHLSHGLGFVTVATAELAGPPDRFADLGTGGGVPGLVLAVSWPRSSGVFVESSGRRCETLEGWVLDLGLGERIRVLEGRAETWAHADGVRETFDLVTARSFARPAVTAEIAAGLVRTNGIVVVSEPPVSADDRWPTAALGRLGLGPARPHVADGAHYACLPKIRLAGANVPRRVGVPAKRPLW